MFRFIHTADIHLDSPLRGLEAHEDAPVEEIRGATRRALENLVDLAVEEDAGFVLIAGDLYDGDWKDYQTGLFFVQQMGRLNRAGIRVFIVSGNHDAASQTTRTMPLPENVTLFSHRQPRSVKLDDLGAAIHGQSYASRAVTENLALQYPAYDPNYFNIGLLHTCLTGREGHEDYAPCTIDDLKSRGYDYWALGHIHKREVVAEAPWIVFPGIIQGRHIKETGAGSATLVSVEDGRIKTVESREIDVLRWAHCRVDLSGSDTVDAVYGAVRQTFEQELDRADGRPLALRLELTGKCPVHSNLFDRMAHWIEEFKAIAAGVGNIWLEKIDFQTGRKTDLEDTAGENTPVAGLLQSFEKLKLDADTLTELLPELSVLKSKLPPEIHSGDAPFMEAGQMARLRTEVRELLIAKLLRHGGTS